MWCAQRLQRKSTSDVFFFPCKLEQQEAGISAVVKRLPSSHKTASSTQNQTKLFLTHNKALYLNVCVTAAASQSSWENGVGPPLPKTKKNTCAMHILGVNTFLVGYLGVIRISWRFITCICERLPAMMTSSSADYTLPRAQGTCFSSSHSASWAFRSRFQSWFGVLMFAEFAVTIVTHAHGGGAVGERRLLRRAVCAYNLSVWVFAWAGGS